MPPKKDKEETAAKEGAKESPKKSPSAKRKKTVEVIDVPKRLQKEEGKRRRKPVERFTEDEEATSPAPAKEVKIKKGKGTKLEDCDNVVSQIKKRRRDDSVLKNVHSIVYGGRVTKQTKIKDNLLAFSGVVYEEGESRETLQAKIARLHFNDIRDILIFFGQDPSGDKAEATENLAKFLEKPAPSTEDYAPKKKKRSTSRSRSRSPARKMKKKKDPNAPKRPMSAYFLYCKDHRKDAVKANPDKKVTDIAKILAKQWKSVSSSDKKKYEKKAAEAKEKYEKAMKEYKKKNKGSSKSSPKKSKGSPKKKKAESGSEAESSGAESS